MNPTTPTDATAAATPESRGHFIYQFIAEDVAAGRNGGQVVTRFPPEPNGFLHIGHAKAICIDFGMAEAFNGRCHLRMDDTNPAKEDESYVRAIKEDVRWLGFDWGEHFYYAADMFEQMHDLAVALIKSGHAYVCDLSQEEWKEYRGIPTEPGIESPYRKRGVEENLDLFARMRAGEFEEGSRCLRARIDMTSPNIHFRDPVLYRIMKQSHYRTGDQWQIYPTYDFAHPIEDALEGVTHSLCTLEFEVHRPLYDWVIDRMQELGMLVVRDGHTIRPQQREFARLSLDYTVMSKRKLLQLVQDQLVEGWDDPRMPTISGLRRRGYPAAAIRDFCDRIGVSKYKSSTELALLESCVRDHLNRTAQRRMAVIDPLRLVIDNYPADAEEWFDAVNNHEDPEADTRKVPFSRELWIEREDFMEFPDKKFFRLAPGREVRLRYACLFTCTSVEHDDEGRVVAVHGTYDPESRGGNAPDGRRVRGTIHWVSIRHAQPLETRLYDRLFTVPDPEADESRHFTEFLNPDSLRCVNAWGEPSLTELLPGETVQFERLAYFCADLRLSRPGQPVMNRTVTLKEARGKN
ncbi:MAG: glutamine--tRNA ligase/YqeY domain fusion protein [Lentisphaerae bacterium]|jgi:glutaminyl-tRNA synthetase|nr:glutamine--tRNA ligase/YqeY domain fusion protein [Lentisphaerota bacterium]